MEWFKKISRELYDLRRDGKIIFRGTANECFIKLHRIQSSSVDHALKYEGYTINPTMKDWKDYKNTGYT